MKANSWTVLLYLKVQNGPDMCNALNDLVRLDPEMGTHGNPVWGNLPRKFNIALSSSRDAFSITRINDLGFQSC